MPHLAQSIAITDAVVDKMLGANFLSLALFVIVLIITVFILFVLLESRRATREGKRQEAYEERNDKVIDAIVGKDSPMVQAVNNFTAAMQDVKKTQSETYDAVQRLDKNVTERSKLDGEAIDEFRTEVRDNVAAVKTDVASVKGDVAAVKQDIKDIRELVEKRLPPADCIDVEKQLKIFEERMISRLEAQAKRETAETLPAGNVIPSDDPPAEDKKIA